MFKKWLITLLAFGALKVFAVHEKDFDQSDPTIKIGYEFIAKISHYSNDSNHLLDAIMRSLMLEYHEASQNQESLKAKKAILSSTIESFSVATTGASLHIARQIVLDRIQNLSKAKKLDYKLLEKVNKKYADTLNVDTKVMILSIMNAFVEINQFQDDYKIIEINMKHLLNLCCKKHEDSIFQWRNKNEEHENYNAFNALKDMLIPKLDRAIDQIAFIEGFDALDAIRVACLKEHRIISSTGIEYTKAKLKMTHLHYFSDRASKLLQNSLARSQNFDHTHSLMVSLFIAYQKYLISEKSKHLKYDSYKNKLFRRSIIGVSIFSVVVLGGQVHAETTNTKDSLFNNRQIVLPILFVLSVFSNFINYVLFYKSTKNEAVTEYLKTH